jgi:hypothetical protein
VTRSKAVTHTSNEVVGAEITVTGSTILDIKEDVSRNY